MFNHNDGLLRLYLKTRYDEFLDEAEKYRLIKEASLSGWRGESKTNKALAWLGRTLVNWGERLERRFEQDASSAVVQSLDLTHESPCSD